LEKLWKRLLHFIRDEGSGFGITLNNTNKRETIDNPLSSLLFFLPQISRIIAEKYLYHLRKSAGTFWIQRDLSSPKENVQRTTEKNIFGN
jgi:hypothetical protein